MSLTARLAEDYLADHPGDVARLLEDLREAELAPVVETLAAGSAETVAAVLDRLSPARGRAVFARLPEQTRHEVLAGAGPRLAVLLLGQLETGARAATLEGLADGPREELERLLAFPADSAGQLMDEVFEPLRPDLEAAEVRRRLRSAAHRGMRAVFVVDDDGRLLGRLDMQDLALAEPAERVGALMRPVAAAVAVTAPRAEIVEQLETHRLQAIPVVDVEGRLLGVVRQPGLMRALEAEARADLQTMVGASADERALSSPGFAVRRRLPWLHINLLTAFLAAGVVGLFEDLISRFTALAILLPVVAGQSGNAGAQALAVTMRGLALREIGTAQWRRVLTKELATGVTNGTALAVTCGAGVWLWSGSPGLALVIAIAMVLSMIAAGLAGALVPMGLIRVGQDPATASSIILTTVTDVAGFFSFLGTATALSFLL